MVDSKSMIELVDEPLQRKTNYIFEGEEITYRWDGLVLDKNTIIDKNARNLGLPNYAFEGERIQFSPISTYRTPALTRKTNFSIGQNNPSVLEQTKSEVPISPKESYDISPESFITAIAIVGIGISATLMNFLRK